MFYLTMHSTHYFTVIWHQPYGKDSKKEIRCRHMGYSFRLAARVLLYASSHRQDNTHHNLCYTSRGALAGTEGKILFNDALNTLYLQLYGIRHVVKDHSDREETCCRHIGYSFWLASKVLLYASSHRQDNTHQSWSTGWNEKWLEQRMNECLTTPQHGNRSAILGVRIRYGWNEIPYRNDVSLLC